MAARARQFRLWHRRIGPLFRVAVIVRKWGRRPETVIAAAGTSTSRCPRSRCLKGFRLSVLGYAHVLGVVSRSLCSLDRFVKPRWSGALLSPRTVSLGAGAWTTSSRRHERCRASHSPCTTSVTLKHDVHETRTPLQRLPSVMINHLRTMFMVLRRGNRHSSRQPALRDGSVGCRRPESHAVTP